MSASSSYMPVVSGPMLDYYLGQGYYRMVQDLFTCRFLAVEGEYHTVHWLRLRLADVHYGPEQRRLLRLNERFSTTIRPLRITPELEALYALYRSSITFDAPETVDAFLLGGATHSIFTTEMLEIRDDGQLIAVGIFDSGTRTLAGIMNFYDPGYRKYSLGKYLMLLKINHARHQQKTFYYPGYLVHNYPKFDYKLFPSLAATEMYNCLNSEWLPFSWEAVNAHSAAIMAELLDEEPDNYDPE
ncbi:GNAT family N-acetyltransferase [Hymenobacter sp. BT186]|uniref:GNAT family N-acetyltransferase n=1 Tax=Hymenobacter telluris TaxID=2816474 RepID=A0A939EY95_9BACT|nr:GNAT family N-acetyltransferase [Hymenobacter telluris]MBO0359715.1 GNAT family N-acetyltransferase [Hymenobacter telluris]MBW3375742.1 GNAT family N-acetyltransferase [Hymenobacter norwichensis]